MTNKDRALIVAERIHSSQVYDIYPYIYHIRQVVKIAEELGYDESIIVACALHDSMEDTHLSFNDIVKAFGSEVAEIVFAVTDELGRSRHERKEKTYPKIKANWKATVVKICDRVANMEHSFLYNSKLYDMYLKELPKFKEELQNENQEIQRAWIRLSNLK